MRVCAVAVVLLALIHKGLCDTEVDVKPEDLDALIQKIEEENQKSFDRVDALLERNRHLDAQTIRDISCRIVHVQYLCWLSKRTCCTMPTLDEMFRCWDASCDAVSTF